jgi:glycosyltransferase involved in cell wall biosynthesis
MIAEGGREGPVVLFGVTAPVTAQMFLCGQLTFFKDLGFRTHLVTSKGPHIHDFAAREGTELHIVPLDREPNILKDVLSLVRLVAIVRHIRPDALIMGTPKMGLAGLAAGWLTATPHRIYILHGLRYQGATGLKQSLLQAMERLSCWLATDVVAVSRSVKQQAIADRIGRIGKFRVLGAGSPNGVDTRLFKPLTHTTRSRLRAELLPDQPDKVVLFVGRLTRDKGTFELLHLSRILAEEMPEACLVVVGQIEARQSADLKVVHELLAAPNVKWIERTSQVHMWHQMADVLVLPTRREGLPTVLLEASSCGVPVVSTTVTGVVDVVTHGRNGFLVPWASAEAFADATLRILRDSELAHEMGTRGRSLATEHFDRLSVWQSWNEYLTEQVCTTSTKRISK